jgi:ribonuclease Z
MLLDCGEGTYGQLCRYYGREGVDRVMKELQCVYVSHLHADHHIGLVGLLKARETLTDQTLYLAAPKQIMTWLRLYHRHFERILDRVLLVPNTDLVRYSFYCYFIEKYWILLVVLSETSFQ